MDILELNNHQRALGEWDEKDAQRKFYPERRNFDPEHQLFLAVFELGIKDARAGFPSAIQWVNGKDETWLFSFTNCCEHLGLEPSAVRRSFSLKACKVKRVTRGEIIVDDELDRYDHPYINQDHGNCCAARYQKAWKRAHKKGAVQC